MPLNNQISAESPDLPADVVAKILSSLREDKKTDGALLTILSTRILTMHPQATAVPDALRDIEQLASARSESIEDGTANQH